MHKTSLITIHLSLKNLQNSKNKRNFAKKYIMRFKIVISMMLILMYNTNVFAGDISYKDVCNAPRMSWNCSDIEHYQGILNSLSDVDYRVYATRLKEKFQLVANPNEPSQKCLMTGTEINIDNPLFKTSNLLNHISKWLNNRNEGWGKELKINEEERTILSRNINGVFITAYQSFGNNCKIAIHPALVIQLKDSNKLEICLATAIYTKYSYSSDGTSLFDKISYNVTDVYPFAAKSSYKRTFGQAYVSTYKYFWNFIASLVDDLNTNFYRDSEMANELHYQFSKDSLYTSYGSPSKIIAFGKPSTDIDTELRFYEHAQKIVFMGKTINFKDIISCNVVDDPQFIPGHSTTYGAGISFFGIGFGGADTYSTPTKTIHNYVVDKGSFI